MGLSPADFRLSFATTNDTAAAASHAKASERSGEAVPTVFETASDAGDPGTASAKATPAALLIFKAVSQLQDRESRRTPRQTSSGVHGFQKSRGGRHQAGPGPSVFSSVICARVPWAFWHPLKTSLAPSDSPDSLS